MIYDIIGTVNFSQVQVYNNELINYVVINRGLSRLYDNDIAIVDHLSSDIINNFNELDSKILVVQNDVGNVEVEIPILQAQVATLSSNLANYPQWNTTYSIVNPNYNYWSQAYTLLVSNSATWDAAAGGGSGVTQLNELTDVNIGTPGAGQDGYSLAWNNSTGFWEPTNIAGGGGGVTESEVSGIVDAYDAENAWSTTATAWNLNSSNLLLTDSYVRSTSSDFALKNNVHGYNYNSWWINKDEGTDSASNLERSFYNPLATAAYVLSNADMFDTTTAGHNLKQSASIYVNSAIDDVNADLANETLTYDGNAGGGTINSLHLVLQYKAARDATFNMPEGDTTQLARISGCTFGFTDINESQSYTTFDGFYISDCTFGSGDANQQFYFKNCHIVIDTLTLSNACEFHFDNSCTIDAGTFAFDGSLTMKNKGIPTYSTNGTDPSTISGSFAGFTGPYIYNDTLVQP